jgi:micrococcal nuclease
MTCILRPLFASLLLLLAQLPSAVAASNTLQGVVSHVTDGDTIWVRPAVGAPVKVRLQGVDAPEICQPFGAQAREALSARVLLRFVQVSTRARDVYQRSIGRVNLQGQDVGAWLVAGGYAWSTRYGRREGPYASEEAQARQARRGLWAGSAVEPRLFRKRHGACRPG